MLFRVEGTERATGGRRAAKVEAPSEESARRRANRAGIDVTSVRPFESADDGTAAYGREPERARANVATAPAPVAAAAAVGVRPPPLPQGRSPAPAAPMAIPLGSAVPPETALDYAGPHYDAVAAGDVWQSSGSTIAIRDGAVLPPRCIKCNAPADGGQVQRKFIWNNPALLVLIFLAVIVYVIVAMCTRKTARVTFSVCKRHADRRRMGVIGGWLLVAAGIVAVALAVSNRSLDMVWVALGLMLAGAVWGVAAGYQLTPAKIENGVLELKGAGRAFRESLPVTPGGW